MNFANAVTSSDGLAGNPVNPIESTSTTTGDNSGGSGFMVNSCNFTDSPVHINKLTLSPTVKGGKKYPSHFNPRFIDIQSDKLMLLAPVFQTKQRAEDSGERWFRERMDHIERFVQQNVAVPSEHSPKLSAVGYGPRYSLSCAFPRGCGAFQINPVTGAYDDRY